MSETEPSLQLFDDDPFTINPKRLTIEESEKERNIIVYENGDTDELV